MTFWAKLLTIIVLVLSIAFAAMSGVLFAKRQNLRLELDTEQKVNAASQKQAAERIAGLESGIEQKSAELKNALAQKDAQERDLDSLRAEVDERRVLAEKNQANLEAITDLHAQVVASLDAVTARNLAISKDNEKIVNENRGLIANLSNERKRANDLETLNAAMVNERDELKVALASAEETIKMNEDVFAALARDNIEARPTIERIIAVPQIRGKVASVDEETNIVILNVGANQGVRKNFPFTVFRGGQFVAKINVFEIHDDHCAAQVNSRKLKIELGDNAWTRLY